MPKKYEPSERSSGPPRVVAGRELEVWLFILLFPSIFVVAGGIFLVGFASDRAEARRSAGWQLHSGTIEVSNLTRNKGVTSHHVVYGYEVAGQRHRSARVVFGATSRGDSRRFVARYQVGASVGVRVDPADPGRAALEPRMGSSWWVPPSFGLLFVVVGLAIGHFFVNGSRTTSPQGKARGVRGMAG